MGNDQISKKLPKERGLLNLQMARKAKRKEMLRTAVEKKPEMQPKRKNRGWQAIFSNTLATSSKLFTNVRKNWILWQEKKEFKIKQ